MLVQVCTDFFLFSLFSFFFRFVSLCTLYREFLSAPSRREMRSWITHLADCGVTYISPTRHNDEAQLVVSGKKAARPVYGMEGFLYKRGSFNTAFRRRFFRIEASSDSSQWILVYRGTYTSANSKGYIPLAECHITVPGQPMPANVDVDSYGPESTFEPVEFEFHLVLPERRYILKAANDQERELWVDILRLFASLKPNDSVAPSRPAIENVIPRQRSDSTVDFKYSASPQASPKLSPRALPFRTNGMICK
jgi:PH domain